MVPEGRSFGCIVHETKQRDHEPLEAEAVAAEQRVQFDAPFPRGSTMARHAKPSLELSCHWRLRRKVKRLPYQWSIPMPLALGGRGGEGRCGPEISFCHTLYLLQELFSSPSSCQRHVDYYLLLSATVVPHTT